MSNFISLNTLQDVTALVVQTSPVVKEPRHENPVLRVLFAVGAYLLRVANGFLKLAGISSSRLYHGTPVMALRIGTHLETATPCAITSYNKTGFLIFFADMFALCYYFLRIWQKYTLFIAYFLCKIGVIMLPLVTLSPYQRLPVWFGVALFTVCEM